MSDARLDTTPASTVTSMVELPVDMINLIVKYADDNTLFALCCVSQLLQKIVEAERKQRKSQTQKTIFAGLSYSAKRSAKNNDGFWLWGGKSRGIFSNRYVPEKIPHLSNVVQIVFGEEQTLYLTDDGSAYRNGIKVAFSGSPKIIKIAILNEALFFLTEKGELYAPTHSKRDNVFTKQRIQHLSACGNNLLCLGDGKLIHFSRNGFNTYDIKNITAEEIIQIAASKHHSYLLTRNGNVFWDQEKGHFVLLNGLPKIHELAAGGEHVLFRSEELEVYSLGRNHSGQLGLGDRIDRTTPKKIPGVQNIIEIAAGNKHSLLLTSQRRLIAFGSNKYGQLGIGYANSTSIPTACYQESNVFKNLIAQIEKIIDFYFAGYVSQVSQTKNNKLSLSLNEIKLKMKAHIKQYTFLKDTNVSIENYLNAADTKNIVSNFRNINKACDYLLIRWMFDNAKKDCDMPRFKYYLSLLINDKHFAGLADAGKVQKFMMLFTTDINRFQNIMKKMLEEIDNTLLNNKFTSKYSKKM